MMRERHFRWLMIFVMASLLALIMLVVSKEVEAIEACEAKGGVWLARDYKCVKKEALL